MRNLSIKFVKKGPLVTTSDLSNKVTPNKVTIISTYLIYKSPPFMQEIIGSCSWRFLISYKLEQFGFKLEKKYWDLETCIES